MNTLGQPLGPGARIGIVAPSAPVEKARFEEGLTYLQSLGLEPVCAPSVGQEYGYLSGTDEVRARDINRFFADPSIDGILCLRGGYGAARLLELLDYETIAAWPKLFIGFSDITALHTALRQRCGLATIHGPMLMNLGGAATPYTFAQFAAGLTEPALPGPITLPPGWVLEPLVEGTVHGNLTGGNMMLLANLTGTPNGLDGTGDILFLEEIGEEAYSLDRMLRQFEQSSLISRVQAVVFGEFVHCTPVEPEAGEFTVRDVLTYYARRWGKPAACGLPYGHGKTNGWLPLGRPATLRVTADSVSLILEDI